MKLKKAAMFGLDARVALAIFGSISLISGASLYNAITESKAESFVTQLREVVKASQQYHFDNRTYIPILDDSIDQLQIRLLFDDNFDARKTWNGPYLELKGSSTMPKNIVSAYVSSSSIYGLFLAKTSDWHPTGFLSANKCVIGSSDCAEWVGIVTNSSTYQSKGKELFNMLDEYVDGGDGEKTGNVRYNNQFYGVIMYKGIVRKKFSDG